MAGGYAKPLAIEVDLIELNHKYSDEGHAFDQVILWRYNPTFRRYDAIGWAIVSELKDYPTETSGWHRVGPFAFDHRKFKSRMYRETVTRDDPERISTRLNQKNPPEQVLKR
jgi:hypothetical protein